MMKKMRYNLFMLFFTPWIAHSAEYLKTMPDLSSGGTQVNSIVWGLSSDGTFSTGEVTYNNRRRGFIWSASTGMIEFGVLRSDNVGNSIGYGISANGDAVAGKATTGSGYYHAFRWTQATGIVDLGTLGNRNTDHSFANAISADGNTVVGGSTSSTFSNLRAFLWTPSSGMIDIGSLRSDNSGLVEAKGISADGSVVVGFSDSDNNEFHAFRWTASSMTDLGTLRSDNSGFSDARAISADGMVIVGVAETDDNTGHAVRWSAGGTSKTDLGTLKSDNSGYSAASAVSADGNVIAGRSLNNANLERAFRWTAATGMEDLGTLRSDNGGEARAHAISADGNVIGGESDTDSGFRAALWRIIPPPVVTPPGVTLPAVTAPTVIKVDVDNARNARLRQAQDTFSLMETQRLALRNLQRICLTQSQGDVCYRADLDYQSVTPLASLSGDVIFGYGVTDDWSVGIGFGNDISRDMPGSVRNSSNNFGVGAWTHWKHPVENGQWYATLAGSANWGKFDFSPDYYTYDDAGKGTSDMKGWSVSGEAGRSFTLTQKTSVSLFAGIAHDEVTAGGYTEKGNGFPWTYADTKYGLTYAYLGTSAAYAVTDNLRWVTTARGEQDLDEKDAEFRGSEQYLGTVSKKAELTHTRYQVSSGIDWALAPKTSISVTPFAGNTAMGDAQVGGNIALYGRF